MKIVESFMTLLFNNQNSSGIRKPVSPNDLMQLQKTNSPDKNIPNKINNQTQKIETPKEKVKAPKSRPNTAPSHKKITNKTKISTVKEKDVKNYPG